MQGLSEILKEIEDCSFEFYGHQRFILVDKVESILIKRHVSETGNDGWIPVDRKLPPNANHKGALCPRYQVMTKYGVTEGWYNPDYESWFCLLWFMNKKFTKEYIDFERGDVPKVVQIEKGIDIVLAWMPLPEPYKPKRREKS